MTTESPPKLIRLPRVIELTSLQRTTIYDRVARGAFPAPREISSRCSVWLEQDVLDWILKRPLAAAGRKAEKRAAAQPVAA